MSTIAVSSLGETVADLEVVRRTIKYGNEAGHPMSYYLDAEFDTKKWHHRVDAH